MSLGVVWLVVNFFGLIALGAWAQGDIAPAMVFGALAGAASLWGSRSV